MRKTEHKCIYSSFFFISFPGRYSIETRLSNFQHHYIKPYQTEFYKYVTTKGEQQIKTDFGIKRTPAIICVRDGRIAERIDDLDESNPAVADTTKPGEESNDEKRVKQILDKLCKQSDAAIPTTTA